jgi:hypothetical protein
MGRPKKPADERKSHQIAIRVTNAEYAKLERGAIKASRKQQRGVSVSEYIRLKLGFLR